MGRERTRRGGFIGAIESVLARGSTRALLSFAIILSLVPHGYIEDDAWFLVLFAPEFVARALVACYRETDDGLGAPIWTWPKTSDTMLLLVDFVALASFLPLPVAQNARWLRLLRLTRTVLLLRYWSPVVVDLWTVVRRRERSRQLTLMAMAVIIVAFAGTVFLNHATEGVAEDFDANGEVGNPGDHRFGVRMWWAFRQIQDPGNLMQSPREAGTLIISVALTLFGLFMVSFLIGVGTEVVSELMELSQLRSSGLRRHTVLVNVQQGTRKLLYEAVHEYRKLMPAGLRLLSPRWLREFRGNARRQREFAVLGRHPEAPEFMREPALARVIYRAHGGEDDEAFLDRADIPLARRVVVMADFEAENPDDETIRMLITIVERLRDEADIDRSVRTALIAELLDESNAGAAERALARAGGRLEARVVPTERLVALFVFCVARRPGAAALLHELLASRGFELYMYDYARGLEDGAPPPPRFDLAPAELLEQLYWRGTLRPPARRVIPLGVVLSSEQKSPTVVLNPAADTRVAPEHRFAGFVAMAPNLRIAGEFADELAARPAFVGAPATITTAGVPALAPERATAVERVLVCGFRAPTVGTLAALVAACPQTEILVLVRDEDARAGALDALDAHSNLVRRGMLTPDRGSFVGDGAELQCDLGRGATGRIVIAVADWTSSRALSALPHGFGSAAELDLVLMISSERAGSDATTSTALMKLEHLHAHESAGQPKRSGPTVVAEVINADLAHRLTRRYRKMGRTDVVVFSVHELRAFFMFQSMLVPELTRIYSELLGPSGQGFVRLRVTAAGAGRCPFAELAAHLRGLGHVLVAVEQLTMTGGPRLFIGQGDPRSDQIDLKLLRSVWVLQRQP